MLYIGMGREAFAPFSLRRPGMIQTYEGIYESGAIRLADNVRLPEPTKVYVVAPEIAEEAVYHIASPRLADPRQAADFVKERVDEGAAAAIR
jgi:hypothetical protein